MSASATIPATASPGELFAQAYAKDGARAEVRYDYNVIEALKPSADRPRVHVAHLFKKRRVDTDVTRFWRESRPRPEEARGVREGGLRQEATFRFGMDEAGVHPITAWVQIPPELEHDLPALATFIDLRLLVRLATAENQALTRGPHGVLSHPDLTRMPYRGNYISGVMAACNEIEQNGATAHAMIVNPFDFYHQMVGKDTLLTDLARNGTLIARTRMVERGCALIRIGEPPAGTFIEPGGTAVTAEIYEGLAIHLPTHFFHVVPA
jgi:hypothetical protein